MVICFGLTIGVMLIAMLPVIIAMVVMGIDTQVGINALIHNPFGFSIFSPVISALMVLGLWLAFRNIHRRSFLTLIRADQTIRWTQIGKGALVWLGLGLLAIGALALLSPGRYQVTFVAQDWFQFLIPALIAIPAIALFQGLVYAYLLQGLGLLIHKPTRLAIVMALIQGLSSQIGQPPNILVFASVIALAGFVAWIVLENQGIELFLGICIARLALMFLVLRSPDAPAPFPTVLQRTDAGLDLIGVITLLVTMALFYGICLGWPWQRVAPTNNPD
ncbi:MAG: hypothetical protein HC812_04650 [Leptolyngbya sp. RL_3_1]|nr:hypothetical protein [Leptolyngbya sp. RL_3_1]